MGRSAKALELSQRVLGSEKKVGKIGKVEVACGGEEIAMMKGYSNLSSER